ncbi:MAG: sialate O-acetylesterase [Verrucomicrobiota bacterium]
MMFSLPLRFAVVAALSTATALADVKLPAIISDHMVLEKSSRVPIWGKADPGEKVTVTLNGQSAKATADAGGKWTASLDLKSSAPGPFEMTVEGKNKLTLTDVVVGEVWVASGQSNMEFTLMRSLDAEPEIARSANPLLRQFLVKKNPTREPLEDTEGAWVAASPETAGTFSAVGYYFAKKLQNEMKVPVGLIHTSWGGTPSEAWTSVEAIDSVPDLKAKREQLWTATEEFPAKKKAYVEGFGAWLKENAREDRPVADAAAFAGVDVSTDGWTPVKVPGPIAAKGLPETGAVWMRTEVNLPSKPLSNISLNLPIDGFDSVYWNGKLLKQTTFLDCLSAGNVRRGGQYDVPPAEIREGKNILAIRFFAPARPAKFTGEPKAGPISLSGEWAAKAEYDFPSLDPQKLAAAPQPPANPPGPQNVASFLFNGMIHPILPYAIRGAIWYQGESNSGRAYQYRTAFPLMITDWRKQWNQGDFPFYFCQLANFMAKKPDPGDSAWAELRDAQTSTLKLPNTGQAVLIEIGESGDIHPRNKRDVGERLAAIALAKDYKKSVPYSGPVYDSLKIENGKVVITFKHADDGLVAKPLPETFVVKSQTKETAPLVRNSPSSQIEGFAICGEDKKWVWADAKIQGNTVIVSSDQVPAPIAVRYAWADNPTCNLYNGAGFPASPFRTDDFPPTTISGTY